MKLFQLSGPFSKSLNIFFVKIKSLVQSSIERLDLGMISTNILILALASLASLASAQPPPHHKVNGFVPSKRYGKEQLQNEDMPRGFEVKAQQVIESKIVTLFNKTSNFVFSSFFTFTSIFLEAILICELSNGHMTKIVIYANPVNLGGFVC